MKQSIGRFVGHFLFAAGLGALGMVFVPPSSVAKAESVQCYKCSGEVCVPSTAGWTYCSVMGGKCTLGGSPCGIVNPTSGGE